MKSATLTEADTAALFAGTLVPPRTSETSEDATRDYVARYSRCSACGDLTPALMTFSGDNDWASMIDLDDPIRDAIRTLRARRGRRTILLCSPCVGDLGGTAAPAPVSSFTARLFEP